MNAYGISDREAGAVLDKHKDYIRRWFRLLPPYEDIEYDYDIKIDRDKPYGKLEGIKYDYLEGIIEYGIAIRCENGKHKRIQVYPNQVELLPEPEFIGVGI